MNINYSIHGININIKLKQRHKTTNRLFLLLLIILNLNFASPQNATTCFEMYSNKTIEQNCFNTTACCFVEYSFYNNTYVKCIEKLNNTEDICSGMNDITSKEGASLSYCSCFSEFLTINTFIIFIAIMNFILG